jgi:glycosyltransferase involved in cell wall biosynthesis
MSTAVAEALDLEVQLLIPQDDVLDPEISIVIPAMNERITIAEFVRWCKEGLQKAGVVGEILIVDSSSDGTPQLALENGARVLRTPKRGLGRAYIDAIPFIRGKYVLMGDADCTYDFREISGFVEHFRAGSEYIMGSRFKGEIERGAMPPLHQYFGTPVTTWILNRLYSTHFSDIHCGLRGITRDALIRIELESQSWEYASEMVLKSVSMGLSTSEVPVRFLKDRDGRVSHMKRGGRWEPWRAGWINLRAMFIYGADYFLLRPGFVLLVLGLLLTLPLSFGPVRFGAITFSFYWMLFGLSVSILGLQSFFLGCVAQVVCDLTGRARKRWLGRFTYTRTVLGSVLLVLAGVALSGPLVWRYMTRGFRLSGDLSPLNHLALTGLLCCVFGFMTFTFTLVLHAAALRTRQGQGGS